MYCLFVSIAGALLVIAVPWVATLAQSLRRMSKKLTSTLALQGVHCAQETIICMHQQ